ncbi:MAG: N utilization substance protein A [Fusobacteria bacterium]|nr:MAG: N utilization substance protein A [Fusobacteriota bacterium]KAF0229671.1 MAG: N utilization substance protein [Fusobacteriota bacterium]
MNEKLIEAVKDLESDKGISSEMLFETIETAIVMGLKRKHATDHKHEKLDVKTPYDNFKAELNRNNGEIKIYFMREVVEEVVDSDSQVSLAEAEAKFGAVTVGQIIKEEVEMDTKTMGRMVAQTAKQIITQKIREIERTNIFDEFSKKEKDLVTGIISRISPANKDDENSGKYNVFLTIGNGEVILPPEEQVENERYHIGERLKVYLVNVKKTTKNPVITISRRHKDLIKRLFELEVPEIHDGTVLIKGIAREAGSRTKIAVYSTQENVDPVGACIGTRGSRIGNVLNELGSSKENGEKIDIIEYSEKLEEYISNALAPAQIMDIVLREEINEAKVLVSRDIFSLAIGKDGQNVRLAAKLTGWKIDILSDEQVKDLKDI